MAVRVRPFIPSDYDSYVEIHSATYPEHPLDLDGAKHEDWWLGRTRFKMKRYVAEANGEVVAVGSFFHEVFSYNPHAFAIRVEVHPKSQHQGIGSLIYEMLISELRAIGAERVWTPIPATAQSQKFATQRGFVETRRELESVLDLSRFDATRLEPTLTKVEAEGVVLKDLASEIKNDPDAGRKLFDLEMGVNDDVPNVVKSEPLTYDEYAMIILQSPIFLHNGCFVAKAGGRYVGSSNLMKGGLDGRMAQGFTAVRKEYRGRGIALALKLSVANYAANHGAKFLRTSNDSANAPILGLNRKIGFVQMHAWPIFEKELA